MNRQIITNYAFGNYHDDESLLATCGSSILVGVTTKTDRIYHVSLTSGDQVAQN
jgi:hypothetical protein